MSLRQSLTVFALLAAALAAGCAEDLYRTRLVEPADEKGRECVARCELPRTQCRERQAYRERECHERHTAAQTDYDRCLGAHSIACVRPEPCLGADTSICEVEQEGCWSACGARVESDFNAWWKPGAADAQTGTQTGTQPGTQPGTQTGTPTGSQAAPKPAPAPGSAPG